MEETPGLDAGAKRPALARQRQTLILERVREQGGVRVADLVRELGVSDMTVRRDLELLDERGLIEKVHGGAAAIDGSALFEPGFTVKSTLMQSEKTLIAGSAASLVAPGTAIAISAGTTTFALARRLDRRSRPDGPDQLSAGCGRSLQGRSPGPDGHSERRRPHPSDALVGPFAVEVIRSLHVDSVFMGTHGMDSRSGFTTPNILEAETNRALIEAGRRLIVLADHTKWGVIGISSVARLEDADTIITDSGLDPAARSQLASAVRRLILVDVATGDVQTIEGGNGHSTRPLKPGGRA